MENDNKPIGKTLRFQTTHLEFANSLGRRFGVCACLEHSAVSQTNWTMTGFYNKTLSRAIVNAGKAAMRLSKR